VECFRRLGMYRRARRMARESERQEIFTEMEGELPPTGRHGCAAAGRRARLLAPREARLCLRALFWNRPMTGSASRHGAFPLPGSEAYLHTYSTYISSWWRCVSAR